MRIANTRRTAREQARALDETAAEALAQPSLAPGKEIGKVGFGTYLSDFPVNQISLGVFEQPTPGSSPTAGLRLLLVKFHS